MEEGIFKVRSVSDQNCMDSFETPKEAKNKEELCVKNLENPNYSQQDSVNLLTQQVYLTS